MTELLYLTIATPTQMLVDKQAIKTLRAMDDSGSFGVLAKHENLITAICDSVLRWQDGAGQRHYCAVRSGVLSVENGSSVNIACREGLLGDDVSLLEARVRKYHLSEADANQAEVIRQLRLHTQAMRKIMTYLRPSGGHGSTHEFLFGDKA